MNRPMPADAEQRRVARELHTHITEAKTSEDMCAVLQQIRKAWIDGRLTRRQLNAIRDKFQYRRAYSFDPDTIPRL